jgi:hypothetical protein
MSVRSDDHLAPPEPRVSKYIREETRYDEHDVQRRILHTPDQSAH